MKRKAAIVISETMLLAFGIVISFILLSSMGSMIFKGQSDESTNSALNSVAKSIAQDIDNIAAEAGSVSQVYEIPKGLKVNVSVDYKQVLVRGDDTRQSALFQALTHTRPYTIDKPRYICIVKNQDDMRISLSKDKCVCNTNDDRCDPACILEEYCDPQCNKDNVFDNVCDRRCSRQADGICDPDCFTNDKDKINELFDCMGAYDEDSSGVKKLKDKDRICDGDTHNLKDNICDPDCLNNATSLWGTCDPDCNNYDTFESDGIISSQDGYCDLDCGYKESGGMKILSEDGVCDLDCKDAKDITDPDCEPEPLPDIPLGSILCDPNPPGAPVSVNSDKTLCLYGKKTFPVGMYSICSAFYEKYDKVTPCDPSRNKEFLFDAGGALGGYSTGSSYFQTVTPKFEANNVYWSTIVTSAQSALKDSPYFFGYYQLDEPKDGTAEWPSSTQAECEAKIWQNALPAVWTGGKCYYPDARPLLASRYNNAKIKDPNHPVILNLWEKMTTWTEDSARTFADIITWDIYTISTNAYWPREDSIYAYEQYSEQSFFNGKNINSVSVPIWAVIQANGIDQQVGTKLLHPSTPGEARANTYTAITMDVKGIAFYGYEIWSDWPVNPEGNFGLYSNAAMHAYYRQLATEVRSLNDILVLPTMDYRWHYHDGTMVSFSKTLTKNVLWKDRTNFNYMLKQDGDKYYLIVVNKDSRPIYDVEITISGLTGTMTAKTLGKQTTGSSEAGRTLALTDGKFTDSFDGYAVHIYEIS